MESLGDVVVDLGGLEGANFVKRAGERAEGGFRHLANLRPHEPFGEARRLAHPQEVPQGDVARIVFAADLHRHPLPERRVDGGAHDVVGGGEARAGAAVEHGEVLGVRVAVADEEVEDDAVEQLDGVRERQLHFAEQAEAVGEAGAALGLVLDLRIAAEQLAEVLLVEADGASGAVRGAVEALGGVVDLAAGAEEPARGGGETGAAGEPHAEQLVGDGLREARDAGLDDVRRGGAAQRQDDPVPADAGDELVLRAGAGDAEALLAHVERTRRQLAQDARGLLGRKLAVVARPLRGRGPPGREEGDRAGAVLADLAQQSERVLGREAEDLRDAASHALVGQEPREERRHVALGVGLLAERKREGERLGAGLAEVVRGVGEGEGAAVGTERPDAAVAEMDGEFLHALLLPAVADVETVAEGVEDGEQLAQLHRSLAVLQVGHEPKPRVRDAGELRLRHALFAPLLADERADFLAGGQFSRHIVSSRTGMKLAETSRECKPKFPSGNK